MRRAMECIPSGVCGNVSFTEEVKPEVLYSLATFQFIDNSVCVGYGTKHLKLIDSDEIKILEFLVTYLRNAYVHT